MAVGLEMPLATTPSLNPEGNVAAGEEQRLRESKARVRSWALLFISVAEDV
jgi:hypothetical protein